MYELGRVYLGDIPFLESELQKDLRPYYKVIQENPHKLVSLVRAIEAFCQVQLGRRANGLSSGDIS